MREIKFRAWDSHNRIWLENRLFNISMDGVLKRNSSMGSISGTIIEQYTGLKDKNGKEIYEGDICAYWSDSDIVDGRIVSKRDYTVCQIQFIDGGFVTSNDDDFLLGKWIYDESTDFEVIGNIHENPELL